MKNVIVGLVVVVVLVAGFFAFNSYIYKEKQGEGPALSHKDATYVIDGTVVALKNGVAETEAAAGSASKTTTKYFGNDLVTDLDGDGRDDVVFLLTHDGGGSGTFYYVVAALNTAEGYKGSQALLLGDRIAPQTTELSQNPAHKQVVVVNYADRAPGEPMTVSPSVGKSIWLKLDPSSMQFGEVANDFEGEADPSKMTLGMKTWTWVRANLNDGSEIVPKGTKPFTVTFSVAEGKFTATTDCNNMGGSFTAKDGTIAMTDLYSTKMFCEGSQEMEFQKLLTDSTSYHFTSRGELILDLKFDSGTVTFR